MSAEAPTCTLCRCDLRPHERPEGICDRCLKPGTPLYVGQVWDSNDDGQTRCPTCGHVLRTIAEPDDEVPTEGSKP